MSSPKPVRINLQARLRAVLDWFHRPRPISAVSAAAPAAEPKATAPFTREDLKAMIPELLPDLLKNALADPARDPELTRALRAALLGPVMPIGAATCGSQTAETIAKFCVTGSATFDDSVITQASGKIGINTATPIATLHVAGSVGGSIPTSFAAIINGRLATVASNESTYLVQQGGFGELSTYDYGNSQAMPLALNMNGGNVGIGTSAPSNTLSLDGNGSRTFGMDRHTTANTAGNNLTVQAGGATLNATSKDGGTLILKPGLSTGTGTGKIQFQSPSPATSSGTSDNSFLTRLEIAESNLSSPPESIATRIGGQLYTVPTSGQTQSAALFLKVVPKESGVDKNVFGILGEVTSDQADGYGGFMKIAHSGAGDAIFIPLHGPGGVALEAACNADGTKGIISTQQGNYPNSTLFTALWQQSTSPNYGMYYASDAPGNALLIQKYERNTNTSNPGGPFYCNPSATQIRLMESDLARERYALQNNGTIRWGMSVQGQVTGTSVAGSSSLSTANDYYYVVTVVDAAGVESYPSSWGRANPTVSLPSVRVDWTAVPGRASYKLYRAAVTHTTNSTPPALSSYQLLTTTTSNTFTDSGGGASGAIPTTGNPLLAQIGMGSSEPSFLLASNFGLGTATPASLLSVGDSSQFQVNTSGKVAQYNGIATVSNGIPTELATVDLTAQSMAIAATTLFEVPATGAGLYRISYVAKVTRTATISSQLGGSTGFQIIYTDKDDSVAVTTVATAGPTTNSTQTYISGVIIVPAKASTNIQYKIDYASSGATSMQYNLYIKCEAL